MPEATSIIPVEIIENRIYLIRGHKVMLDSDLAELYRVPTKALLQAVKRNRDRFPDDFVLQLNLVEAQTLRSQTVTASKRNIRYLPFAFTEQGVAMLSSVLRSPRAVHVNIEIMRAFVRLRQMVSANKELASKLAELERKVDTHDNQIHSVFEAIRKLMAPPPDTTRRSIGFKDA
jgi:hypothetical protein